MLNSQTAPASRPADSQSLEAVQHGRLLLGAAQACVRLESADVSVEDVIREAGMSRRTFYDLFADSEQCVLAALHAGYAQIARAVQAGCDALPEGPWVSRVRAALVEAFGLLDAQPDLARLCLAHARSGGDRAVDAHQAFVDTLARELQRAARADTADRARDEIPHDQAPLLVGAIFALVQRHLSAPDAGSLQSLVPTLMYAVCVAYDGPAAAAEESRRPPGTPVCDWSGPGWEHVTPPVLRAEAVRPELTSRTLLCLVANPGASNTEIARHLSISAKTIARHLAWLADQGLIAAQHRSVTRNAWNVTPVGLHALREHASADH